LRDSRPGARRATRRWTRDRRPGGSEDATLMMARVQAICATAARVPGVQPGGGLAIAAPAARKTPP
ncbi:hypothetical protein CPT11_28215, partial [Klebsiella pneumoniae]